MAAKAIADAADASGRPPRRLIAWLRNDLRLHDNVVLHEAASRVKRGEADEVLPVYVFDPRFFACSSYGAGTAVIDGQDAAKNAAIPKMGPYRAKFLLESVADLQRSLRALGSDLAVRVGPAEEVIPPLQGEGGAVAVLTHEEVTSEEERQEARVERALKRAAAGSAKGSGPKVVRLWGGATMYHPDDLPFAKGTMADLPDVFTQFRERAERLGKVRPELPTPTKGSLPLPDASSLPPGTLGAPLPRWSDLPWPAALPVPAQPSTPPHPRAAIAFEGGETAALKRLKHYLWDTDAIATYFETRNGMLGEDYSTKFAPWLASGCLSPRRVFSEVKKYERERTEGGQGTKNTYWVLFELTWRDFFVFWARKQGNKIFFLGGPTGGKRSGAGTESVQWRHNPELFKRWAEGRTGHPLVDANMRELRQTGFMSNRGRQNVASLLALDYGLDWRLGAALFEYFLIDYTPVANWGNWVCAAGMNGGRVNRFNIPKQSKDYDPDGEYAKAWVPELRGLPPSAMAEPHLASRGVQEAAKCVIGVDYPAPVPARDLAWRGYGDGGGGGGRGRGGSGGRGGGRGGGGRGGGGRGGGRRRPSEFEMYG